MKKTIMFSIFIFIVVLLINPVYGEDFPKEGKSSASGYYTSSFQTLNMGKERVQINYDGYGVITSKEKKNIFNNATQHVLGSMHVFNGAIEDAGFIETTLTNGDKVYSTYKGSGKMGKPPVVKGTYTYVGGTGKMNGIQGGGEFTRYSLRPPAEGISASFSFTQSNWKIVE